MAALGVTASGLMMGQSILEPTRRIKSSNKLDAVERVLMAHYLISNRLSERTGVKRL